MPEVFSTNESSYFGGSRVGDTDNTQISKKTQKNRIVKSPAQRIKLDVSVNSWQLL